MHQVPNLQFEGYNILTGYKSLFKPKIKDPNTTSIDLTVVPLLRSLNRYLETGKCLS